MSPDLVIGIDFGMTFSGVAYFLPEKSNEERVKILQTWPGREDKTENKVPTSLIYHGKALESWGFLCDRANRPDHPEPHRHQYFKLWLDRQRLERVFPDHDSPSYEDVKKWFTDYLDKLHSHIKRTFSDGPYAAQWNGKVNFVFSVPTTWTWKNHRVVETYKQCIRNAGFGKGGKQHEFSIGLTEAEAAAIHTFRSEAMSIKDRDVILVCDAGGGTTDVAVLERVSSPQQSSQLKQLDYDFGKPVGSVRIDQAFASLVKGRLAKVVERVPLLAEEGDWAKSTAWEMAQGDFQYYKCAFGTKEGTFNQFKMKIPELPWNGEEPAAFVNKKHMQFTRQTMSSLFDAQLEGDDGIFSILDAQLDQLKKTEPEKQVDYMVLSGGLGSSAYIKSEIVKRYVNKAQRYPNAKKLKVVTAESPQLAVVQGLVLDQAQRIKEGHNVLKSRNCRASFGVLHQEPYDEVRHIGMKVETDPLDGKLYAIDLIHWFVEKGHPVPGKEPIEYDFRRKVSPTDNLKKNHWKSTVVVSYNDRLALPTALGEDAKPLCVITSDTSHLTPQDFEKKTTGWFARSHFFIAYYKVKVIIGAADVVFEVWHNGKKLSKDHPISVEWGEGAEMSGPWEKPQDILMR